MVTRSAVCPSLRPQHSPLATPPSGVTTNPVLLQRAAVPCTLPACHRLADQAFALGAHELMLQAWGGGREELISCGLALSEPDRERIVIKLPVTEEGTAAASVLAPLGVRVCLTACYARRQALVAVAVGAEYLAPYLGRMHDAGMVSASQHSLRHGAGAYPVQPHVRREG